MVNHEYLLFKHVLEDSANNINSRHGLCQDPRTKGNCLCYILKMEDLTLISYLNFQVILIGEYGVGKSSLFRRFTTNTFVTATDRSVTLGLDNFSKTYDVGEKALKLQLWDTGGMERVASITSSYYKYSEAAILVFALDRPDTFHVLAQHLLDIVTYAENGNLSVPNYLCMYLLLKLDFSQFSLQPKYSYVAISLT